VSDHGTPPTEEEMRSQMFRTMRALEQMALSVSDLFADSQPTEEETETTYRSSADVQAEVDQLRDRVSRGEACDHQHTQTQCRICAKWMETALVPEPQVNEGAQVNEPAPLTHELEQINKMLAKQHRALALVAGYAEFEKSVFQVPPADSITSLIRLKVCRLCAGTGWVARDESCDECGMRGYVKT